MVSMGSPLSGAGCFFIVVAWVAARIFFRGAARRSLSQTCGLLLFLNSHRDKACWGRDPRNSRRRLGLHVFVVSQKC